MSAEKSIVFYTIQQGKRFLHSQHSFKPMSTDVVLMTYKEAKTKYKEIYQKFFNGSKIVPIRLSICD